jgi:Glyoxalase/Bleomycin resistance protein/Dioxygenase superfamily
LLAKGSYARIILATADLDCAVARLQASGADVVQAPTEQPYGVRDCAFRDPAGNLIQHKRAALSRPTIAAMTCTDGTVRRCAQISYPFQLVLVDGRIL